MRGTFTGIGVGPGDPELLTLKAARLIRDCCVAAVPVSDPGLAGPVYEEASGSSAYGIYLEKCAAYQIALNAVPELAEKAKLFLPMPMIKDKEVLRKIMTRMPRQRKRSWMKERHHIPDAGRSDCIFYLHVCS